VVRPFAGVKSIWGLLNGGHASTTVACDRWSKTFKTRGINDLPPLSLATVPSVLVQRQIEEQRAIGILHNDAQLR